MKNIFTTRFFLLLLPGLLMTHIAWSQCVVTVTADPETICEGGSSTLTAIANGQEPYTYQWDQGLGSGFSKVVSPIATTTYTVTVTDGNNETCVDSVEVIVTIIGATTSATPTTCGLNNGSVMVTPSGGSGYTYLWMPGNYTTQTVNNLGSGTYDVTVTSGNGCTATSSATVGSSNGITATASATPTTCGQNKGSVTVTPSGGSGYTYLWMPGNYTTQTVNNLGSGTYDVTVTSGNGCTATSSATVGSSNGISATTSATPTTCGLNNGSVTVTPLGGSGYTYLWMPGNYTTQMVNNLAPGTYNVTVTSGNGCTATSSATVGSSNGISATTSATPTTCGLNNGSVTVTPMGGSG